MKTSIIIPAYNEEATLGETVKRIKAQKELKNVEIVIVNDGSNDNTGKIANSIVEKHASVRCIQSRRNWGKGKAIQKGLRASTGEVIVIQDADLEYHPKFITRLTKPIYAKKSLVVYGTRLKIKPNFFGKNKTPFLLHFFGNKFLSLVTSLLYNSPITDIETGYKAFHTSTLKGIKLKSTGFEFEAELTAKFLLKGVKVKEVKITTAPRSYKEGKKIKAIPDGVKALWTLIKLRIKD